MEKHDFISSITLLIFGVIIFVESLKYPFGELNSPGAAFLPRIAATILISASVFILIDSFKKVNIEKKKVFLTREAAKRVGLALAFLLAYRLLFPVLGFTMINFLFFLLTTRFLGGFTWKTSLLFSLCVTAGSYLLFQRLLEIPMPLGILKI